MHDDTAYGLRENGKVSFHKMADGKRECIEDNLKVIEISDAKALVASRGFLVVKDTEGERKELGQIPLDDIAAVIG